MAFLPNKDSFLDPGPTTNLATPTLHLRTPVSPTTAQPSNFPLPQERHAARLRDYLVIAPALHVSHMLIFTLTEAANVHLRVARLPAGPTVTFRVERYSLMK
jgi:hypothetical protein